jgi:hypothetical protein
MRKIVIGASFAGFNFWRNGKSREERDWSFSFLPVTVMFTG